MQIPLDFDALNIDTSPRPLSNTYFRAVLWGLLFKQAVIFALGTDK